MRGDGTGFAITIGVEQKAMNARTQQTETQEMETRRRLIMKRAIEILGWLTAVALFAFAGHAVFGQTPSQQNVTITVRPAQTVEERVADEVKEKALRKAAEEKLAAEESAKIAESSPGALLSRAHTVYISSGTSFFSPVQLQNALRKREEFDVWEMAIIDDWNKQNVADVLIEVGRPLFTYTFTYKVTHRSTGVVLATGKVTAFDSNGAAPKLAKRIVEEIKKARGETRGKR